MIARLTTRLPLPCRPVLLLLVAGCLPARAGQSGTPVELDRVVAVVNNHAILASDLNDEMRVAILEPDGDRRAAKPEEALDRLISRTLIRQQIRAEDEATLLPTGQEVEARISELRRQLPACVNENCATDEGWRAFLLAHGLTEDWVERYLRGRMEILRFIEVRFRQGIRIAPEQVEAYYRKTLLPQYPAGQPVPPLDKVAPRIEEILLQEQVTGMFGGWLDNLRKQGDIEVLDPSLEGAAVARNPVQTAPPGTIPETVHGTLGGSVPGAATER